MAGFSATDLADLELRGATGPREVGPGFRACDSLARALARLARL
jgi:hypothetical protein